MSCTQANIFLPHVKVGVPYRPSRSSYFYPSRLNVSAIHKGEGHKAFPGLVCSPSKYKRFGPICLAMGNMKSENGGFSWESLKKTMEDMGKEQMGKHEFGGNGGGRGPPREGGGGDGSGGDDGGLPAIMDEVLQVVLATIGFIFVYVYLMRGAELTRLARDYIKYVFGAPASLRLMRAMEKWGEFYASIINTAEVRKNWLERTIAAIPTCWHNPRKLVELIRSWDC